MLKSASSDCDCATFAPRYIRRAATRACRNHGGYTRDHRGYTRARAASVGSQTESMNWSGSVSSLPSFALLLIFVLSAVVIWGAGTKLSDYTDVLAERLHLGEALGGVVLLAVATNLPEIAITVSAALSGQI